MLIRNKHFPYPIIAEGNDSYASANFITDVDSERDGYYVKFTLKASTNNVGMNDLIKDKKASNHISNSSKQAQWRCANKHGYCSERRY